MSIQPSYQATNTLSDAIRRLGESRANGQELEDGINLGMQLWVSYIMAKQTSADKPGIKAYLLGKSRRNAPVRRYTKSGKKESSSARYLELRNSVAAAIVYASDYKNARSLAPAAFFGLVGKYIAARVYSSGHHKAGFRPALREFKSKRSASALGQAPNYGNASGRATSAHSVGGGTVTASASNVAAGVENNPGGGMSAVEASEGEVVAQLERFILKNLEERAAKLGLQVT